MRKIFTILAAVAVTGTSLAQDYYSVRSGNGALLTFDISDGTQVDSIATSFSNQTTNVDGFNGMAMDPTTGDIYVAVKDDNSTRFLGTIDPSTGIITTVGTFSFNCSSITFDANGNIFAADGQGSPALHWVNKADATDSVYYNWNDSGGDGEAIGFNSNNGLLYRYSGDSDGDFISLNLTTFTEDSIATFANIDTWGGSLYFSSTNDNFIQASGDEFYEVTTAGVVTLLSNIGTGFGGSFKGIVKANTTSVKETENEFTVSIFPNPSEGKFTISTENEFALEVIDITGKIIQNHVNVQNINLTTKGVYVLRFKSNNKTYTQKVIVK